MSYVQSSGGDQVPTTVPPKEAAHRVPVIEEKPPVSAAPSPPEEKKAVTEGVADTKQKKTGTQDVPTKKVPSPEELFETTKAKGNKHVQKVSGMRIESITSWSVLFCSSTTVYWEETARRKSGYHCVNYLA